ncbi:hypothetical protein [Parasedimentitalea huanghaiensis]|uniref:hypothetical protein n=1 Tax=Parasedimentitalea huanghaiensis TaxID=2682100 RepID=UPI0014300FD2|nr:hypothetical protein [Zongyanglinia huanghaiensis]
MTAKTRFLNSIITSAKTQDITMPWTRGSVRRASIARRRNTQDNTQVTVTPTAKSA